MSDLRNTTPGTAITVNLTDGTTLDGTFVSVNSKGLNLKVDGKVISRSLTRVATFAVVTTPDVPADLFEDGGTYGAAAIAAVLEMSAYDLRVLLRDMHLGVGKGNKYGFDAGDATNIVRAIKASATITDAS
jgi:hypothetical protein